MAACLRQGRAAVLPLPTAAIRQIREKGYADAYKGDRRPVTLAGINFRKVKRNIDEPLFDPFPDCQLQA